MPALYKFSTATVLTFGYRKNIPAASYIDGKKQLVCLHYLARTENGLTDQFDTTITATNRVYLSTESYLIYSFLQGHTLLPPFYRPFYRYTHFIRYYY